MKAAPLQSKFFKKNTESFVGINLGNYYLKGLVVKEGNIENYFIEEKGNLSATLKKLWVEKKIPVRKVKVSVKNPTCLVRYFSFPKMERKKLNQALKYELSNFIPFPAQDVYYDFFVLKEISSSEVLILLAVAKKEFIDQIIETFAEVNLKISEISLDSVCLTNLFLNNYENSREVNVCILDIGYNFSTMIILNKGVPFLTRDIKFSVKDTFQVVARIKNFLLSDTEKWIASLEDNKEFLELAQGGISNLCKEMKSSFDYLEVNKGEPIGGLYLSGGLSSVKGIERMFVDFLDTDVSILEVLPKRQKKWGKAFSDDKFNSFKNNFSAAFGLVL